jgi:hypothetical protein
LATALFNAINGPSTPPAADVVDVEPGATARLVGEVAVPPPAHAVETTATAQIAIAAIELLKCFVGRISMSPIDCVRAGHYSLPDLTGRSIARIELYEQIKFTSFPAYPSNG